MDKASLYWLAADFSRAQPKSTIMQGGLTANTADDNTSSGRFYAKEVAHH
ncbi:hypothetical protein [Biomaibacter acetigenes]|nr:hypothetical protein [Biomaibacter acetigenes]